MKLEAEFKSQNNSLFYISGEAVSLEGIPALEAKMCKPGTEAAAFCCVKLPWSLCGLNEESYNEEFLAEFRDWLKELEERSQYCFMVPVADSELSSESQKEDFVQSMKHAARRIKDCRSVIGFAIPEGVDAGYFVEELSAKHGHYVFFSNSQDLLKDSSIVRY